MAWRRWREHFENNRLRAVPAIRDDLDIPESWREPLIESLGKFLLGETGEGRIAHEIDRSSLDGIDDDYRAALKLFIAEEGRHARVLGQALKALGGKAPRATWSETLFRRSRRAMGVRTKLMVLLSAEIIALGFYGAIADQLPASSLREALEQILEDERDHQAFHCDFFGTQLRGSRTREAIFLSAWWAVATSACSVVMVDHWHTLGTIGASRPVAALHILELIHQTGLRAVEAGRPAAVALDLEARVVIV